MEPVGKLFGIFPKWQKITLFVFPREAEDKEYLILAERSPIFKTEEDKDDDVEENIFPEEIFKIPFLVCSFVFQTEPKKSRNPVFLFQTGAIFQKFQEKFRYEVGSQKFVYYLQFGHGHLISS